MRYDPCGRVVAMVRRPYRTKCRFFSDSTEENTIHWYVVPWGNGTLPYPHRIIPADWFPDRVNTKDIGEHSWEERPFDGWGRIVPPNPANDHICGTKEDFAGGCLRDSSRPPLVRGPDGIPDCCRPIPKGLVLGGTGEVNLGVARALLDGGTPIFVGENDCAAAPLWHPLTQGRTIVMWGGFAGIPSVGVAGLAAGGNYRVSVTTSDAGNTVQMWGGVFCSFPAVTYFTDTGATSYTEDISVPGTGAPTQWIRNTAPYPAPSWLVITVVPL